MFGSDQGLVGQFNEVIAEFAIEELAALPGRPRAWAVGERVQARLVDAGLSVMTPFIVPGSVQAIAPLIGQILLETETCRHRDESSALHLFYNHPGKGALYAPVSQRLLPLDETWRDQLAAQPRLTGNLPGVLGAPATTLRTLIREYLFVSLFRASAESLASENASRLAAMARLTNRLRLRKESTCREILPSRNRPPIDRTELFYRLVVSGPAHEGLTLGQTLDSRRM